MRLGGPVPNAYATPGEWASAVRGLGYGAAYCPVSADAGEEEVESYAAAAADADIVIAEVGAWSNPLSPDSHKREAALEKCRRQLALADRIGARCCVNIAGSTREGDGGTIWHGPHADDLTDAAFDRIVRSVRVIIDAVAPTRTCYTLETMPWMYPDSAESYRRLIEAVNRDRFAAHLDPVNIISSPRKYFRNAAVLRECFVLLGPFIRSCHAKDIRLDSRLTVHLDEVRPGTGGLDWGVYLRELEALGADTPLMLEHLRSEEEYALAAAHIRTVAGEVGVRIK